ncbi:DUF1343 domain-containing protein [Tetragenococcus koreensis]|uniref:exo-beta-N-acetylmuramidase NamZ family protein n=1 Tax=Tetragenococcus koreensis TaxID=290335 RepID=UPI001F1F7722|nr:DUF1343 domain-containing protein [Tetragenococcus koreensis]MDN6631163.1 DUF1343 domain-containing protein [Staphylococcus equorum]MDN6836837.1 DUF1343 domain-containing protein [Lactococcus lactis]MCF1585154.1 DUF1343 domain-containing protein [Tetragenococcus koreensis]MCF1614773.1 DUF1343 domain-containing protein [Tetragenococcus koreensis]MCF1618863.1 DUF1343 domain-containing protein [Tetragenococcus koreensis]
MFKTRGKSWFLVLMFLCLSILGIVKSASADENEDFQFGVEVLLDEQKNLLEGKRVGLVTNPTGVNQNLQSDVDLLFNDPDIDLTALYGPEHGVRGNEEAGEYVEFYTDPETELPVYSLYGETQKPSDEMLEEVDTLVFDIQDAGVTYYTYVWTMYNLIEAAAENDKEVVILDRPNPLGGDRVEGPVEVEDDQASFVGLKDLAMVHGMTFGEIAEYFNEEFNLDADLSVVQMKNYDRSKRYADLDVPFVMPSPNMPTTDSIDVYPITGYFETFENVSEGRGTAKPFQLIGAEFINSTQYAKELNELNLPGVKFRPTAFTPASGQKVEEELAEGVEVYITNPDNYEPVFTGLSMIKVMNDNYSDDIEWRDDEWLAQLTGKSYIEEDLKNGEEIDDIVEKWQPELETFKETREVYLLYDSSNQEDEATSTNSNTAIWTTVGAVVLAGLGILCYVKSRKE